MHIWYYIYIGKLNNMFGKFVENFSSKCADRTFFSYQKKNKNKKINRNEEKF